MVSKLDGDVIIESHPGIFMRHGIRVQQAIANVQKNVPFNIVVANFSDKEVLISKRQIVGHVLYGPPRPYPSSLYFMEVLGLKEDEEPRSRGSCKESSLTWENKYVDVMDRVNKDIVPKSQWTAVEKMLLQHEHLWDGSLGEIKATEHRIKLTSDNCPIRQQSYRADSHERQFERNKVAKMLRDRLIRPSKSEWASPVVLAIKTNGGLRFCVY